MDGKFEDLLLLARREAYGSLGLDPDPEMGFAGVHALRNLADFCETYQVSRARQAGHSWAKIASWVGVTPQAPHKKYAQALKQHQSQNKLRASGHNPRSGRATATGF